METHAFVDLTHHSFLTLFQELVLAVIQVAKLVQVEATINAPRVGMVRQFRAWVCVGHLSLHYRHVPNLV